MFDIFNDLIGILPLRYQFIIPIIFMVLVILMLIIIAKFLGGRL